MKKIDYLIDPIIEFGLEAAEVANRRDQYYHNYDFAREFQTVAIKLPRQCGKSWYIARSCKRSDVIICSNERLIKSMSDRVSLFHMDSMPHIITPRNVFVGSKVKTYHTVWIDDASYVSEEHLRQIYEAYAGWAVQFVLIG